MVVTVYHNPTMANWGQEGKKMCRGLCVYLIFLPILLLSQETTQVSMEFQGVDIPIFLRWFSALTHKKIIYSEVGQNLLQKKLYLIAPDPVPLNSVENISMSLLESNGFTLIKSGQGKSEVYKLVESSQAASKPIAIYSKKKLSKLEDGDYYISQLAMIEHLKVEQVIASLRQAKLFDPQTGSIVEIRSANALIISDFVPNVRRIVKIIEILDKRPPQSKIAIVNLRFAKADEVSQKLQQLYQNKARDLAEYYSPTGPPTILADNRTNALILCGSGEDLNELKLLINHFDKEIKESEVVAKIYKLECITTDKVLPTLREFLNTLLFRERSGQYQVQQTADNQISVIANEYSKTLLITAPLSAHKLLGEVIRELDVRHPQVLLEAVICEFTPSDVLNFGIELMNLDNINEDQGKFVHGITSFGLSSIVDKAGSPITKEKPATPTGRTLAPGTGLVGFITKDSSTNIPILLRALQSVTHTEVISVPRILVDDGERAEIRVEQEEPVTSINALNTSSTTTSFKEFVAAGTALIIKPQIIHKDWLKLEIEQNIEAFVGTSPTAGVPPPKSSRLLKTVVTVPNGHTVILGGLCSRREIESIDKIPLIGDIPIIGLLFQSRSRTVTKTNLYIFLQPKILVDTDFRELKAISAQDMHRVQKLHERAREGEEEQAENATEKTLEQATSASSKK
ncbi:MAG: hypothetical protein HY808_15745 [Nitrospirae bacterium]|nr:hypothetical protein [Nitrospirota bacterium]